MPKLKAFLHQLNRFNPNNSKRNLKLVKIILTLLIVTSLIFRVSQNLAQETESTEEDIQISEDSLREFAQYQKDTLEAQNNISAEAWGKSQLLNTMQIFTTSTIGNFTIDNNNNVSYQPGGMATGTTNLIAKTFSSQPASGVEYIAQIGNNILGKPAYAQTGVGFRGLQSLLSVWRTFRNIIYLISSVYFVILGIMIMFRLKINPQTILTIQNSIPKVITTLLLVSFSYAIAGLVIDLSYIIQDVILASLFTASGKNLSQNLFGSITILKTNAFKSLSTASFWDTWRLYKSAIPNVIIHTLVILTSVIIGIVAGAVSSGLGAVIGIGALAILELIFAIIIIVNLLKFFFGLLKVYVNILFKIILAPLEIGIGAFPGIKIGFNSWLTGLFANVMVFPIIFLFLVIVNLILSNTKVLSFQDLWSPNMLQGDWTQIINFVQAGTLINSGALMIHLSIGFSTLLILAKLPEMIPQVIFSLKPSPWESAIGEAAKAPKWLSQGSQMAVGSTATQVANELTAPTWNAATNSWTGPARVRGLGGTAVNILSSFFGGKPRGT